MDSTEMNSEQEQRKKQARRAALLLGLMALCIYAAFIISTGLQR